MISILMSDSLVLYVLTLFVTSVELSGSVDTPTCNHFMSAKVFLYREQFDVYETDAQIAFKIMANFFVQLYLKLVC